MFGQTEIVLLCAAVAVVAFLVWRSRREAKTVKAQNDKLRRPADDVLMTESGDAPEEAGDAQVRMTSAEAKLEEAIGDDFADDDAEDAEAPSSMPPIYDMLDREKEERRAAQLAEAETRKEAPAVKGVACPQVDAALEWILDMSATPEHPFTLGILESLRAELKNAGLKLPYNLWVRDAKDGLYYRGVEQLPHAADHVVLSVLFANRAAKLDDVTASAILQAMESVAAQYDSTIRHSHELKAAIEAAGQCKSFVEYFDGAFELELKCADEHPVTPEELAPVAAAAGFTPASGRYEYRCEAASRDPEMTLELVHEEGCRAIRLTLDVPLVQIARSDVARFYGFMNHFAAHLGATPVETNGQPVTALNAVMHEEALRRRAREMRKHGVEAGSARAALLFSRSA